MDVQRLADDAYILIGSDYGSSSLVLTRGTDAMLIEAMGSRRDAADLHSWITRSLKARVRLIVTTHYFSDHIAAVERFPDALVIAHSRWRAVWESEAYRSDEEASWIVEPTIEIDDRLRIRWGRFELDLFHNPGHTAGTLNVDILPLDLIHVGDTLVGNLAYFRYSSVESLLDAISRIRARGRSRVLSSHGTVRDAVAVDHVEHYIRRIVNRVNAVRSSMEPDESILEIPARDCYPERVTPTPFEEVFHRRNLEWFLQRAS